MRIALVADTHGSLDPRVAEVVAACALCIHAGDIGGAAVLDALRPSGRVYAVSGNNDSPRHWAAADHARLAELPILMRLPLPGGELVVTHGDRVLPARTRHERLRRMYESARAVVYGHSHRLIVDERSLPWVLNPGAAGRARTHGGPSCLVLDAEPDGWRVEVHRFAPV